MAKFISSLIFLNMMAIWPLLGNMPREVVVLQLPANEQENWREARRLVKQSSGEIEFVPFRERVACYKKYIGISYFDRSLFESKYTCSMKTVLNFLSRKVFDHKTWQTLEANDDSALVEWTDGLTYTLSRIFLTERYIHIVFMSSSEKPSEGERLARITALQSIPCVLSTKEALSAGGMCILAPWSLPVNMDEGFPGWRLATTEYPDNGDRIFTFVRKWEKEENCRELISLMKFAHQKSLEGAFEAISLVLKDQYKQVTVTKLGQSDSELALMFEAKEKGLPVTKVMRFFRNNDAVLRLGYECIGILSKKEVASWLEKMRCVKFD